MENIQIENKIIGGNHPCFIIAEVGVNHNGDVKLAKALIDEAVKAGVDAVKFQTFKTEDLVTRNAKMASYQKKNLNIRDSQFSMLKRLELSHQNFIILKKYCRKKGIIFLSTAHTESEIDFLDKIVSIHKVASGDLTNIPLLEKIAKTKKSVILSTGMGTMLEIKEAISALRNNRNGKIIVLHCTTNYPCSLDEVNLRAMLSIQKETGLLVGYSDHTKGTIVSAIAVAMGAKVIEKHFTMDKMLPGPDHSASLDPKDLKQMVDLIRDTEKILGNDIKTPSRSEKKISIDARKSIVAKVDISKGEKIKPEMLIIKRPGNGIKPGEIKLVIGKSAKANIPADSLINWKQI